MADIYSLIIRADTSDIRRGRQDLNRFGDQADDTRGGVDRLRGSFGGLASAVAVAATALGAAGLAKSVLATVKSTQVLQASLKTVTGSLGAANEAWSDLLDFAKTTPFTLDQSVQGFIRMKSLGLDPTEKALRSFGNTSAAMGKDLMQMIEAVADASTGEFERLKEFGIRASKQGDQVTFTFQGVETTVKNSSRAITGYLEGIGSTTFAGAMADQMDTLAGKTSNLEDGIDALYRAIGDAGATAAFEASLDATAQTVETLTENIDTVADAAAALAIIIGGSVVGALSRSVAGMVASTAASIQNTNAQAAASVALLRRTGAEKAVALALLNTSRLDVAATAGTNAHTFALTALTAARARATTAAGAHAAATAAATSAMTVGAVAARALTGAMALLGGPIGIAIIAAGSLYYFRDALFGTSEQLTRTEQDVKALSDRMDGLTEAEIRHDRTGIERKLRATAEALVNARKEAERLTKAQSDSAANSAFGIGEVSVLADMGQANTAVSELEAESNRLNAELVQVNGRLEEISTKGAVKQLEDLKTSTQEAAAAAAKAADQMAKDYASVIGALNPGQAEFTRYADQIDMIDSFNISMGEKEALREESFRQHRERMIAIASDGNAGMIEQQASYSEARKNIDAAMLSSASSVASGLASVIADSQGKQSKAYQAAFLVQQGFAVATSIINTQMAAAAALAPPPIGLGPVAGLPYAGIIEGLGAANVAIIAAQTVSGLVSNASGARAMGGSVTGGNSYLVGENGPEVVTMGGSGVVTPSSVNNNGGATNVTQVFQLGGGDGDAKRQILAAAPFIRAQAKQAVLEAIGQGGAMTRAVGRRS